MSRIGIVLGMQAEAATIAAASRSLSAELRPLVAISGADPRRAREGAERLVAQGARALLSFGLAGGLDPELASGEVVIGHDVVMPDGARLETDLAWRAALADALSAGERGRPVMVLGRDHPAFLPAEKAALRLATSADVIDMESHAVAAAARAAGLPFMVLRVVLDAAERAIPWSAQAGLGRDGSARALPVLGRLLARPQELPALLGLARETRQALAVLSGLAAELSPAFGFLV